MKPEEKIYEIKERIAFYQMQKTNLQYKDGWQADDYTWNNELSKDIAKLEAWIAEIQSEIKVTSAGQVVEDGLFRSAVLHG